MPIPVLSKRLTVTEAAAAANRHPKTIQLALAAGDLHGTQRVAGGRWLVKEVCLEAWLDNASCEHQPTNVLPMHDRRASA